MNNTQKLLLRVMDRVPRNSKNALAKAIGANEANTRKYLKGDRYPNAAHAIKIAEILGMDVQQVIFYIQEDKTKNPEQKELLQRKLPRLHSAAAVALALLAGSIIGGNWDAQASAVGQRLTSDFCSPSYTLCEVVKSVFHRFLRKSRNLWPTFLWPSESPAHPALP